MTVAIIEMIVAIADMIAVTVTREEIFGLYLFYF